MRSITILYVYIRYTYKYTYMYYAQCNSEEPSTKHIHAVHKWDKYSFSVVFINNL